jgi:hypothetical protein
MKKLRFVVVGLLELALCLCISGVFGARLSAQTSYGSIAGTVTDATGGAISDAQVTITNVASGEKRVQTTGPDGLYNFVNLIPGTYKIEVEKTGFKHITHPDVVVQVEQTARIDITMQVGDVSQTVEVTGETPLLQPETSSLGQVVEGRKVSELPLNGRNVFNLVTLAPSVVPQGSAGGTPVGVNPFGWGNYQVNGSFGNESAEYLDGQPLNIGYINLPVIIPTQDSVEEFKVQTSNTGADWGKFSGGVMNFSTKSGTNGLPSLDPASLRRARQNFLVLQLGSFPPSAGCFTGADDRPHSRRVGGRFLGSWHRADHGPMRRNRDSRCSLSELHWEADTLSGQRHSGFSA